MLAIRPTCEHCNTSLPYDSEEAMICTFECTYCRDCVENVLHEVCPNCGGNFTPRPVRPKDLLEKYPVSKKIVHKPVDVQAHLRRIGKI
ncbi:DUF1272 domain-containing protein [Spongiimicrobium sp. 2-473A-2-J]|uniref:DUF1272 domain-containing protein n=1 Tax=Eudoraea algarum TaxID=3417568 RepID=UPI003D35FF5D